MPRSKNPRESKSTTQKTAGGEPAATHTMPRIESHRAELVSLCRRYHVVRLELFGSEPTGRSRAGGSDLDLLVEFESRPPCGYADAYFGLLESLERLFGRPVDLVVDSAITNPYFRQSVDETRTVVYAA